MEVTDESTGRPGIGRLLYESILGLAAGFSVGWFTWLIADRLTDQTLALWPFAVGGIVLGVTVVRYISTRRTGRGSVHLLWIPVVLFVILMSMIVLALRAFE
jgi:hypothetical protein